MILVGNILTACNSGNISNEAFEESPPERRLIENKFVPLNGQTLFFMGQDIDTINEYVTETRHQPSALTVYVNVNEAGVYQRANHPNGPLDLQSYIAGYPNSVISVGLSMIETYDRIVDGDPGLRKSVDKIIQELKNTNQPIFLRIGYEADGYWNNYRPDAYKKMWSYVVGRIAALEAENIATVWQLATHCGMKEENRGLGNTLKGMHYDEWWPEDPATVDWVAFSYFSQLQDCPGNNLSGGLPPEYGSLGDMNEIGESLALENVVNYLKTKNKPIMIAESTPKRFDIKNLTYKMSYDTTIDDRLDKSPLDIWQGWFVPYFDFINRHQDSIKAVAYINMPWNSYKGWACKPEGGSKEGNCSQGYWGDARVHTNEKVLSFWKKAINLPQFLSSGHNGMFDKLTGWGSIELVKPSGQLPYTRYHLPHAIPGVVQAEHFDIGGPGFAYVDKDTLNQGRRFDTQCRPNEEVDTGALAEGNCAVGWMYAGEWLEYTVETKSSFIGSVYLSIASPIGGGHVQLTIDGEVQSNLIVPNTGAWNKFQEVELKGVRFKEGKQVLRLSIVASGSQSSSVGNMDFIRISNPDSSVAVKKPFKGRLNAIPGKIEAENYDLGGEGVAYHDLSPGDSGEQFSIPCARKEDVDIGNGEAVKCAVGWTIAGEWIDYSTRVVESGLYDITVNVASEGKGGKFKLLLDREEIAEFEVPKTSSWVRYRQVTIKGVPLAAGKATLRMLFTENGNGGATPGNVDYIEFTKHQGKGKPDAKGSQQKPYKGKIANIPGLIVAGHYDEGGQDIAYFDNTKGNTAHVEWGSTCRIKDDVDVASYGKDCVLSYTEEGEWVEYTVKVKKAGNYTVKTTVYAGGHGGLFQLQLGGKGLTSPIRIKSTGDWGAAGVIKTTGVNLPEGTHTLRLYFVENGEVGTVGNISSLEFIPEK